MKRTMLVVTLIVALVSAAFAQNEERAAKLDALKALRGLDSATEIGINFKDYTSRLIDAKTAVKGITSEHVYISAALGDYELARTFWNLWITAGLYMPERIGVPSGAIPESMIKIHPALDKFRTTGVTKEELLSILWGTARKHIDKAAAELEGKESK